MKTLRNVYIILVLLTFCSCDNSSVNNVETIKSDSVVSDTADTYAVSTTNDPINTENEYYQDTLLNIKFKDFVVSFSWTKDPEGYFEITDQVYGDTVIILADLGETIEEQKISVLGDSITNIVIEQSYETSITIMEEGPHCDLTNWKHYYSEWKQLEILPNGFYVYQKYTEKEAEKFPPIQIEELREQVKAQCGIGWHKNVSQIKSPTEYPSGVGISRYFVRISGQLKGSSQRFSKLRIVENPMGC